ncbi:bifunctional DNA primase/polymerase [Saccharopolyspora sp. K220]|uniref:bifunctional DNA primase/polymerase n=1 Tax=Saccharopolyspora soli TaxID=2926618 RepID=UPI001F5A5B16|nr:bifunctional DNA primase/polymerase [Saccharopolyspora soli]MCI2420103.1 bifunctional DNA primase/polymerase [Saccharopolyspora soli]
MSRSDEIPPKREPSEPEIAAVRYAEQGWSVLPGSAFNGRRYVVPGTVKVTDGVRPIVARNLATTDPEQAARWWQVADDRLVPTVLLRSGPSFGFVSVAANLAKLVLRTEVWQSEPGPVLYREDLVRAHFLVDSHELSVSGHQPGEVVELARGEWVAAPPSRTFGGDVVWWVAPETVEWCPVNASVLGAALTVACRDRDTDAALRGLWKAVGADAQA